MSLKLIVASTYLALCFLAGIVGAIFLYLGLCFLAGIAGRHRRIGFWGFFFSSIMFTPFISFLYLYIAMPRRL